MSQVNQTRAGRYDQLFDSFQTTCGDLLEKKKKNELVFCFVYDTTTNTARYEVFEAQYSPKPEHELIEFGNDLAFKNKLWFFFESDSGRPQLEAGVAYMVDYRPQIYIDRKSVLMTKQIEQIPHVAGLTKH